MASPAREQRREARQNGKPDGPPIAADSAIDLETLKGDSDTPQPASGVALLVVHDDQGNLKVIPQLMGETRITEMTTVIELGLKSARSMLGLTAP